MTWHLTSVSHYSLGYLCNIRVEPTTNCNSNETYVILIQMHSRITSGNRRSGTWLLRQYIIPRESIIKNKCISTFWVTEHPLYTQQYKNDVIKIIYNLVYNWKKYNVSHRLVSNRILLICIAVEAKITSISKVPKSLKRPYVKHPLR